MVVDVESVALVIVTIPEVIILSVDATPVNPDPLPLKLAAVIIPVVLTEAVPVNPDASPVYITRYITTKSSSSDNPRNFSVPNNI